MSNQISDTEVRKIEVGLGYLTSLVSFWLALLSTLVAYLVTGIIIFFPAATLSMLLMFVSMIKTRKHPEGIKYIQSLMRRRK